MTREQFLMRETRAVARLRLAGADDAEVVRRAVEDNLFQYPTLASAGNIARTCIRRLDALASAPAGGQVLSLIAEGPAVPAAQANLYAMARVYAVVWEFLVRVVGWHYGTLDYTLTVRDVNVFLADVRSEEPAAAAWSEATLVKTRQVLRSCLVRAGQLEGPGSERLVPVLLDADLERAMRANGDARLLPAFNCLGVA